MARREVLINTWYRHSIGFYPATQLICSREVYQQRIHKPLHRGRIALLTSIHEPLDNSLARPDRT